jgi:hypothetical protein
MSPFNVLNDPRESKEWMPVVRVDGADPTQAVPLANRFGRELKRTAKIICFTRDDPDYVEVGHVPHAGRGFAHPRLWSHYGGAHRGVCLAFEIDTLGDDITASIGDTGEVRYGPVNYSEDPYQQGLLQGVCK